MSKKIKSVKNMTSFDELANDLKSDIFRRLDVKDRGKFKCVSKEWRDLITASCFPIFYGFLYMIRNINKSLAQVYSISYQPNSHKNNNFIFQGQFKLASSDPLSDPFTRQLQDELQESCNGLILSCHKRKERLEAPKDGTLTFYDYLVINPLTKQYVVVAKPKKHSSLYKYAALAYDPAESSSHFRIVRFRVNSLDIYSSKTRRWTKSVKFRVDAKRAEWKKQSLYLNGSIYRLSMSGHVLRFDIDNVDKETKDSPLVVGEIEIPAKINESSCIGLSKGHINLAINDGSSLKIWELNHQTNGWSLKFSCSSKEISPYSARPLAFHPYLDAIFVGYKAYSTVYFRCLHYGGEIKRMSETLQCSSIVSRWAKDHKLGFPLFQCEAPFASDIAKRV